MNGRASLIKRILSRFPNVEYCILSSTIRVCFFSNHFVEKNNILIFDLNSFTPNLEVIDEPRIPLVSR